MQLHATELRRTDYWPSRIISRVGISRPIGSGTSPREPLAVFIVYSGRREATLPQRRALEARIDRGLSRAWTCLDATGSFNRLSHCYRLSTRLLLLDINKPERNVRFPRRSNISVKYNLFTAYRDIRDRTEEDLRRVGNRFKSFERDGKEETVVTFVTVAVEKR